MATKNPKNTGVFFEVTDNTTGETTRVPFSQAKQYGLNASNLSQTSIPLYRTGTGWSANINQATGAVTLDKTTGKITVQVPKDVQNSYVWKEYLEGMQSLSAAYKNNPNAKFPITDKEGQATGETRTIDEMIAWLNEAPSANNYNSIQSVVQSIRGLRRSGEEAKEYVKTVFGSDVGLSFSDEILNKYIGALATGDEATDSSYLWVSDLPALEFMRALESYNSETGLAQRKDILENAWSRGAVSETQLDAAVNALEAYFEEGDFSNEEEFLKNLATYNFLVKENVGDSLFSKAMEVGGYTLAASTRAAIDDIARFIGFFTNLTGITEGNESESDSFTDRAMAFLTGSEVEDIEQTWHLAQVKNSGVGTARAIGELGGLIEAGVIEGKVLTGALSAITGKLAQVAKVFANAGEGALAGAKVYQQVLTAAALAVDNVEDVINLGQTVAKGSVLFNAAEGIAILSKIPGGVKVLTKLYSGLRTVTKVISGAGKLSKGQKFVSALVNQLTDYISSIASQEPELLSKFLRSKDLSDEDKAQLLSVAQSTALMQAGFGLAGKTLGAGLGVLKRTHVYQALNANLSRKIAKYSLKLSNIMKTIQLKTLGKIKGATNWDDYIRSIRSAKKRTAWDYDKLINQAREVLAESERVGYRGTEKAKEALAAVQETIQNIRALNAARTIAMQEGASYIQRWLYSIEYPELRASWQKLQESTDEIIAAEKKAGMRGYAIKAGAGRTFAQETIDYIGAQSKIPFLENYINRFSKDTGKSQKVALAEEELAVLRGFVKTFLDRATDELVEAANKYIGFQKSFWYNFTDLRVAEGLSIKDEIDEDRASMLWGNGGRDYVRTQRITKEKNFLIMNSDGTFYRRLTTDLDEYIIGAKEHFVDPFITQVLAIKQAASQRARLDFAEAFIKTKSPVTLLSGEDSRLLWSSEQVEKARQALTKETNQLLDGIIDSFDQSGAIKDLFSSKKRTRFGVFNRGGASTFTYQANASALSDEAISDLFTRGYGEGVTGDSLVKQAATENGTIDFSGMSDSTSRTIRNGIDEYRAAHDLPTSETYTIRDYQAAVAYDPTISQRVTRSYVLSNSELMGSKYAQGLVDRQMQEISTFHQGTLYKDSVKQLREAVKALPAKYRKVLTNAPELFEALVDDFVEEMANSKTLKNTIASLIEAGSVSDSAAATRYLILRELYNNSEATTARLQEYISKTIDGVIDTSKLSVKQKDDLTNAIIGLFNDVVEAKYGDAVTVARGACIGIVDEGDFAQRVSALRDKVQGFKSDPSIIGVPDIRGNLEYYQVDPALNRLMTHSTGRQALSGVQRVNYLWSKMWRFGTTTWRLASMVRQTFTDSYNAIVGGGMYQSIKASKAELTELFGDHVAEFISTYTPETIQALEKAAGVTIEEALEGGAAAQKIGEAMADFEIRQGRLAAGGATELAAYNIGAEGYATRYIGQRGAKLTMDSSLSLRQRIKNITNGITNPHDVREVALRSTVYANSLNDALQNKMSLDQARIFADFMMQEGTTNFSVLLSHLTTLGDNVPYLASTINGTKSFYRLLSLDPLGVFGRLFTNVTIPAMSLAAYSLLPEENREIYKNLKEYQKNNNLVFVLGGQVFTIPLSPEIGAFVNPFRQLVEGMFGVQEHTAWELLLNDAAGFSPIDITGFTSPDYGKIALASGVKDWFSAGTMRVASQIMPPAIKTAWIIATRQDPFTGNTIGNRSYYWDDDTQTLQLAGTDSQKAAQLLASLTNEFIDAPLADQLLNGIFGTQIVDVLDTIFGWGMLVMGNELAGTWDSGLQAMAADTFGSLYVPQQRDKATADWRSTVYELQRVRDNIIQGKEWQAYLTQYRSAVQAGNTEKLLALAATRKNIWQGYYEQVKAAVDTLNQLYPDQFTAYKMSSAISLMTIFNNTSDENISAGTDEYNSARSAAIETMVRMGFPNAVGEGVLGRIRQDYTDSTGKTTYTSDMLPLVFLDMENKLWYSSTLHQNSIENILKRAGLTRSNMYEEYNKATTSAEKRQAKLNWNTKVVLALWPYVEAYGANTVFNDSSTVKFMQDYLFVDNPFKAKDYLKAIFGGNL